MGDPTTRSHGLAAAMEKAGPSCTSNEGTFQDILKSLPAPTEVAVAEVLAMVTRNSKEGSPAWNADVLVEGLKAANPALAWQHVAGHLDLPDFTVPDASALGVLMAIWRQASSDPFPLRALVGGLWSNAAGQLSFLKYATAAPPEVFSWAHAEPQQEPLEGLHGGKSATGTPNMCWMALDLYSTLASLAESGYAPAVRAILEAPLKACPEILLLGAASVKGGWGSLQAELVDALVATYVAPHPNSSIVLQRLWPLNSDVVLRAMVALHTKDPTTVARSLDICQELKAMTDVLDATPPPFCLELAALAARREYLNLEKWLGEQFSARGVAFMQASVSFLDAKLREDAPPTQPSSPVAATAAAVHPRLNISVETLAVFLRVLATNAGQVPTDTLQQLKLVQAVAVQAHPELSAVISEAGVMEAFPQDVEDEANATFKRMYDGDISVQDVVNLLQQYQGSMEARQQEVFACMVHNLFDEFRFFFKYPDKELHTTAVLFGQLVSHSLVSSVSLGIALRYVLDSLRNEPSHKLFKFGTTAAHQFAAKLSQYPTFAAQLTALPSLKQSDPELVAAAEVAVAKAAAASTAAAEQAKALEAAAAKAPSPPPAPAVSASMNAAGFPTSMPAAPATPNMLFSTINAETLEVAAQTANYPVPDTKVIDRVHFLMNNLTVTNVEVKAKELASLVPSPLHPWFANYLVVKRAAQEPNFHSVYVILVEKWGDRVLVQLFHRTTIHYCKIMLASPLLKTNSSERTLLKNLGAWLGKLTLARNRPVLQRDLDIKATIVEAYTQGKMLPVLSFVRNLLEPCAESKAFRPPNPWVMAILGLLAEIYNLDGIRTSLKFEVELLFKGLNLQVADVPASSLLASRQRDTSADNMDFQPTKPAPGAAASGRPGEPAAAGDGKAPAAAAGPVVDPSVMASLPQYVVINPQLAIVGERLGLKGVVSMSIERAVVEIISPVVDRSVTIACMTAHELVVKDFAVEPDPEVMRNAAHLAVAGLAQSLALVTAREPLRLAVTNNLRSLLSQRLDHAAVEQVVTLLVNDNLDLCCQVIERAAGERAQRELDERLASAYAARARAKAAGQQFADASQLQGRFPAALQEALRARPGALTPQQQKVYADFATIPRTAAAAQQQTAAPPGAPRPPGAMGDEVGPMAPAGEDPLVQLRARFISWVQRMDAAIAREPNGALAALPEGNAVKALVAEVASLPPGEPQAVEIAKNLFYNKLYQNAQSGRMHATAYAGALAVLRDGFVRSLPAEVSLWFASLPEDARGAKEPAEALLRLGLLIPQELDTVLFKSLTTPRYQVAAELLLSLVQSCILSPEPCVSAADLQSSMDALAKLATRISGGQGVLQLLDQAQRASLGRTAPAKPPAPQDPPQLLPAVMKAFDQWARLLEEQPTERVHAAFVQELKETGLLGGDGATERFLRVMTQLAVAHCLRSEIAGTVPTPPGAPPRPAALSFVAIDAYVRLMVCLVTQHGGGPVLLSRVLGAVATHLLQVAEERGGAFNGRPFFRIAIGLLSELSPADAADDMKMQYLEAIAGFLYATRPQRAPVFAFPWLQLVADRRFMPKLLMAGSSRNGWGAYLQLLLAQLGFLEPFLRAAELTDAVRLLYKGTLRLLLVLLHDFPEFLCQSHFRLCDAIPPSCIQMRNLVLSAFPRSMRLPDPFTQDLKVDMLPEVAQPPRYSPAAENLLPPAVRAEVDAILSGKVPAASAGALTQRLVSTQQEYAATGSRYNVPLINAVVFYVGIRAVEASAPTPGTVPPTSGTAAIDLLAALLRDMDNEGRHLVVNALANHLRYPNAHTHYFSCAVLTLFADANDERIQEQITRVLLERLIVNRPHPWGLLITFIELIKNPRFSFWSHSFTRVAPEIERLFESVARSCMGSQAPKPDAPAQAAA